MSVPGYGFIRPGIMRAFRLALRRRTRPGDVDDEIQLHIDLRAERLMRDGVPREMAYEEARRRFGDGERQLHRDANTRDRSMRVKEWLNDLMLDARYSTRSLMREPLFTGSVVLTLALSIGGNAAMFGVADRLLIRGPEHITDPGQVMRVYSTGRAPQGEPFTGNAFGYVTYDVLKRGTNSFNGIAAYQVSRGDITLGRGDDARLINSASATADLFPTLGVRPALGRFFSADEDRTSGGDHVAVIGYGLWQSMFDAKPTALGATITLEDEPYTIVGVAPKGFTGPQLGAVDVWLPMSLRGAASMKDWTSSWNLQFLQIVVRLKPGVSADQANADATAAFRGAYTGSDESLKGATLSVAPLSFNNQGKETLDVTVARWLLGVAIVVLLVACSNVVNLMMARAARRRREVAVRLALGAGRGRLVRLLLTESVMLALIGGVAGLAVAWITGDLLRTLLLRSIEWTSSPVDARVLTVSAAISLGVGIIIGVVPALQASRFDLTTSLKSGVRDGGGQGTRLRASLTIAQSALSMALLVGAGLFVRSLWQIQSLDLGIQPERVLVVSPRWPSTARLAEEARKREQARRGDLAPRLLERIRQLPGVEYASLTVGLPFISGFTQDIRVPGWDSLPSLKGGGPYVNAVASDYFETVGTKLKAGRAFTSADRNGSEPVVIVNELMVSVLWPRRNPIGECIYTGPNDDGTLKCARIVGVVAVARRFGLKEDPAMQYYIPFGQERGIGGTSLVIRPRVLTPAVIESVRHTFMELDPSTVFVQVQTLQESLDPQLRPWKLGATAFGLLGVLALIIAALGLYSVLSYLVAQRTHEFGVRVVLGARGWEIQGLIMRSSLGMTAVGVALGLAAALALGRFVEPLLFDTSARDPLVLGGVAATLLLVALVASLVPGFRARDVNPLEALRSD